MKKLVSLLLTCLLLCSVFMLPAGAQEQPDQAALLQVFKTYLDENDVEYKDWEELVFVEPITQSNGWTIFYGTGQSWPPPPVFRGRIHKNAAPEAAALPLHAAAAENPKRPRPLFSALMPWLQTG